MYEDHTDAFLLAGLVFIILIAAGFAAVHPSENKIMKLGDEVATTDEHTMFFNESFSGRIVSIDELYTVRDQNGNERMFEGKWIDHVDAEGAI